MPHPKANHSIGLGFLVFGINESAVGKWRDDLERVWNLGFERKAVHFLLKRGGKLEA